MKIRMNRMQKSLLAYHTPLGRLGAALLLFGLSALTTASALAGPCGSSQPSNISDTCYSVTPPCLGVAPCTRVVAGRPLWCKYAENSNCLTQEWWEQGGVQVWRDVYANPSNFCSASCACGPISTFSVDIVYETTYSNCSGGS